MPIDTVNREERLKIRRIQVDYRNLVDNMIKLGQEDKWLESAYKRYANAESLPVTDHQMSNRQAIKEYYFYNSPDTEKLSTSDNRENGANSTTGFTLHLFNSLKAFAEKELPNFTEDAAGEDVVNKLKEHFKNFFMALGMIFYKNNPKLLPLAPMGGKKTRKQKAQKEQEGP